MSDQEIYKPIPGFDGYEISNFGNIKTNNKILKYRKDKDGYLRTNLYKDSKPVTVRVHRLVAENFIENPENKRLVDHIDRDVENNYYQNLRWATHSENTLNSKTYNSNTTGYKGVSFIKSRNKYQLSMIINGKNSFVGYFATKEEAVARWNEYAPEIYKEFQPIGINIVEPYVQPTNMTVT